MLTNNDKYMKSYFYSTICLLLFTLSAISCSKKDSCYVADIETSAGKITIMLFNETPLHRDNFIKMANSQFYDSLLFHRVIKNFVIQAGDPTSRGAQEGVLLGEGDADHKIKPEIVPGLHHIRGAVGAAREGDDINPKKLSSGSHFYIVHGGEQQVTEEMLAETEKRLSQPIDSAFKASYLNLGGAPRLDGNYTVWGYVVDGMDVVDAIASSATDDNDRPKSDVHIISVKISELDKPTTQKYYNMYNGKTIEDEK